MLSLPSLFSLVFLVFQRETSQEEAIRKCSIETCYWYHFEELK